MIAICWPCKCWCSLLLNLLVVYGRSVKQIVLESTGFMFSSKMIGNVDVYMFSKFDACFCSVRGSSASWP